VAHSVTSATSAGGSVTLLSVSPRDSASVVARLRYVRRDGAVDTEDRWLSVVPKDGGLLIYDSERIGAARLLGTFRPRSSPAGLAWPQGEKGAT